MLRKKLIYLLPLLSAILVVGGSKAQAQVIGELKAKIPFEFHAGGATLPAGNYTIDVLGGPESNLLEIRNDNNRSAAALIQTIAIDTMSLSNNAGLIFDRADGDYYLEKIFNQDESADVFDSDYAKKYKASLPEGDPKHIAMVYKGN
jgi:hypothetical protein